MGRPKGRTDTTPRKRRGSPRGNAAPVVGVRKVAERSRKIKAQVKSIMRGAKDGFEAEEMRRLRESERGMDYRDRKKRVIVERVQRAEAVGLEAGEG